MLLVNTGPKVGIGGEEGRDTSAAFPTMGRRIKPTKVSEMPLPWTMPSILDTRNSAHTATRTVDTSNLPSTQLPRTGAYSPAAHQGGIEAISFAASDSSVAMSSYKYECDLSWKKRYIPYTKRRMTDVPRLIARTPGSSRSVMPNAARNAAGISSDEIANANNDDAVCATYHQLAF